MKRNGSDILVECLLEQGVDTVFGYPGGAVLNIYDALYKYSGRIRHVLTAHEQGASHAADGYARATGRVGVCIATSGPGATNLVTGIATAYMDSIPMVAVTGNVAVPLLGRDSFQEVDITGITMPITKHNFIVKRVEDLADTVREAFRIARSGRPGPVLIDLPKDITAAETEYEPRPAAGPRPSVPPKEERLQMTLNRLQSCEKPLIYFGGGIISSGAEAELLALAEAQDIPVCSSMMGLGGFPPDHRLWLGMVGMHGTLAANRAARECDLLLACGARFSDRVAGSTTGFAPNAQVVHIDIDHAEFDKNVSVAVRLAGDLRDVLRLLSRRGFNIDSIIACKTEDPGLARWTLVVTGDEATFTQLMRQLLKLEDVIKVEALEMENCSNSELLLIKVRTGPAGRAGLLRTAQTYGGRVLDVGDCTMTLELSGQTEEIEGFVARMAADYGIVELARTGITALRRGDDTIHSPD